MNLLDEFRWQARNAYEWLEAIVSEVTPKRDRLSKGHPGHEGYLTGLDLDSE